MTNFDVGDVDALKSKRSRLLCPRTGVTDVNWGLNAGMYALLSPIQTVMKLLQTTTAPIQHLAMRHINTVKDHLQDVIDGNWKTHGVSQPFVDFCRKQNRVDLCNSVTEVIELFAYACRKDFIRRKDTYMPYYKAMELVDPTSTVANITSDVRAAVRDMCVTHKIANASHALVRMRSRVNSGRNDSNCSRRKFPLTPVSSWLVLHSPQSS